MTIQVKREDVIKKLTANLAIAKKRDAKKLTAWKKADIAILGRFRKDLRRALSWTRNTARKNRYAVRGPNVPHKPTPTAPAIARLIRQLRQDSRKMLPLKDHGELSQAYYLDCKE